jgi:flagellar biosynthesis repressor protein FlbT
MAFAPQTPFPLEINSERGRAPTCASIRQPGGQVMALKVELKSNERILIGESVITNCNQRSWLVIEGSSPILREKDILTAKRADTPAKRIYLAVQLMYTSRDPRAHHEIYFSLVKQIVQAAPSTWQFIESINNQILAGSFYKALKETKKLIAYEEELLQHAKRGANLQKRSKTNIKSA